MAEVRTVHTAELRPEEMRVIRTLLDEAFNGELSEEDHEHALGGMHALVHEGPDLIAHGAVVLRRLLHDGRALRTGYVEGGIFVLPVRATLRPDGDLACDWRDGDVW